MIDPIEVVAKAIEGPWDAAGFYEWSRLEELRDVRWGMLSHVEKTERRNQASAAIHALQKTGLINDAAAERVEA